MKYLATLGTGILLISGCSDSPDQDLRGWMNNIRTQAPTPVVEAPQISPRESFQYDAAGRVDPFTFEKISTLLSTDIAASTIQPDAGRTRELLESFSLESLRLVGSLRRQGQAVALVEADKVIHQVRIGSHLGPDMGKVIAISESAIDIEEVVQETGSGWTRRRTRLAFPENRR